MRKLLLLFVIICSYQGWAGTCGSGYSNVLPVKLIKASGSDQTNFAVRVWGRDYRLATSGNGGLIQNTANNSIGVSGPADLVFCPDQTLTSTPLKYESTPYYSATTGDYEFYVQQPTYHTASNDTVYMYFNNAGVVTTQQDLSLWADLNYVGVFHYGTTSTIGLLNSVTGTAATNVNTATASNIAATGGAGYFNGSNQYFRITDSVSFRPTNTITLESWGWTKAGGSNELISKAYRSTATWSNPFLSYRLIVESTDHISMDVTTAGVLSGATSAGTIPENTWMYAAGTYDSGLGSNNLKAYRNGSLDGQINKAGAIDYSGAATSDPVLGTATPYTSITYWSGRMDEQRIASDAKSADYLASNYTNLLPYKSNHQFVETSYAKPTILQYTSCSADVTTASCVMPFNVSSGGGVMVAIVGMIDGSSCPAMANDSLGLVYTAVPGAAGDYTGTLHHYYECIYTAPITTSGADTVTIPAPGGAANVSAIVFEVKGTSTSGQVGTAAGNNTQPTTMTATSPGSNSILFCTITGDSTNIPGGTTPSTYRLLGGTAQAGSHESLMYVAYGLVGSGSQSCSFAVGVDSITGGPSGAMTILGFAAGSTSKRRMAQVY
jgi:hypothetical protein